METREHPFDAYPRLKQQALDNAAALRGQFPLALLRPVLCRPDAILHVPAADPERHLKHWQFAGLADLIEPLCGPFSNVTTRANLQVRNPPKHAVALIEGIQDLGLCSRGAGADNIRNVTGTPTAGIDPQELLDTRDYAREWHYHILNDRSLIGLPRKFNVAFDGAGKIAVLEDTNDIAFAAVEVKEGFGVEAGIWFRLGIGGITGHKDLPETRIIVKPADAPSHAPPSSGVHRFGVHQPSRARLKCHRRDGHGEIPGLVEEKLGHPFTRVPPSAGAARGLDAWRYRRHQQKQAG